MSRRGLLELSLSVQCLEITGGAWHKCGTRCFLCLCYHGQQINGPSSVFFSEKALLSFKETGTQFQMHKTGKFKPFVCQCCCFWKTLLPWRHPSLLTIFFSPLLHRSLNPEERGLRKTSYLVRVEFSEDSLALIFSHCGALCSSQSTSRRSFSDDG